MHDFSRPAADELFGRLVARSNGHGGCTMAAPTRRRADTRAPLTTSQSSYTGGGGATSVQPGSPRSLPMMRNEPFRPRASQAFMLRLEPHEISPAFSA